MSFVVVVCFWRKLVFFWLDLPARAPGRPTWEAVRCKPGDV